MKRSLILLSIALCGTLQFLAGCLGQVSDPPRYYVLEEMVQESEEPASSLDSDIEEYLQVGPIRLPRYLDRPQIVSRSTGNQLRLGEFDRWSEPLHESFTRVIAGNLGKLLSTNNILIYPNRGPSEDDFYQLRMDVTRFDGSLTGDVTLEARWTIVGRKNRKVIPLVREVHVATAEGNNYQAYVATLNSLLTEMSRTIGKQISAAIEQD